jgi:hypothetical protein
MNVPGFTAESSLYRTSGRYQMTVGFALNGGVLRPQLCSLTCLGNCLDNVCSGLTGEAGTNCRRDCGRSCGCNFPPPIDCGANLNCGNHCCPPGSSCCDHPGCCPAGAHCCNDGHGCCPNGQSCASIFGWHFCLPNPF